MPISSTLSPTFSSISFRIFGIKLKSSIDSELSFVKGVKDEHISSLLHVAIQFEQHHLLKILSFFCYVFLTSFSKKLGVYRRMKYACIFSLIPFTNFSAFVTVPCCFYDYSSVVQIEIGICDTSQSSLIIQGCFRYPLFFFPYDAKKYPFNFCEELCWYFAGGYMWVVEIIFD